MNVASLFNLAGPDLIIILLIVLLLFGAKKWPDQFLRGKGEAIRQFLEERRRWMREEADRRAERENPLATVNRLLVPLAIVIFLLACGLWVFGNGS